MIEVRNLSKDYGPHRAIDDLSFTVNKGEVVGFLGPNGAGKSTTMKIITGFMAPSSGQASISGFDVFEDPIEVKRRIGYLPETPPLYQDMRVREFLLFVAKLKGVESAKLASQVEYAIEKTNLTEVNNRLIRNLSKGFKQRIGIAQAIVSDPEVLILDEPTVGLDPKQVAEIRKLIQELRGQHTIILSTHILSEVQATCERIIIINRGKIVAEDTLAGLEQRMSGASRVRIRIKNENKNVVSALEKVDGVIKVSLGPSSTSFDIDASPQDEVLERISRTAVDGGWGLLEMSTHQTSLEDIFLKLTYDTETGSEVHK